MKEGTYPKRREYTKRVVSEYYSRLSHGAYEEEKVFVATMSYLTSMTTDSSLLPTTLYN